MHHPFDRDKIRDIITRKRRELERGFSYTEKILFLHEAHQNSSKKPKAGVDQIFLYPDRVAMQDATAQMAMLQFMQTGQKKNPCCRHHPLRSSHPGRNRRRSGSTQSPDRQ